MTKIPTHVRNILGKNETAISKASVMEENSYDLDLYATNKRIIKYSRPISQWWLILFGLLTGIIPYFILLSLIGKTKYSGTVEYSRILSITHVSRHPSVSLRIAVFVVGSIFLIMALFFWDLGINYV